MVKGNLDGGKGVLRHARRHTDMNGAIWVTDSVGGPQEACNRSLCKGAILGEAHAWPGHAQRQSAMSCAKTAEPIEMSLGLWARVEFQESYWMGV